MFSSLGLFYLGPLNLEDTLVFCRALNVKDMYCNKKDTLLCMLYFRSNCAFMPFGVYKILAYVCNKAKFVLIFFTL